MATAPVKSQPLHNFSLSFLKWGNKNQLNSHRCRRPPADHHHPPSHPPDHYDNHHSSSSNQDSQENNNEPGTFKHQSGSKPARTRFEAFSFCSEKPQRQVLEREESPTEAAAAAAAVANDDSSPQKPWNLRPRREVLMQQGNSHVQSDCHVPKSMRLRGIAEAQGGVEKNNKEKMMTKKRKFSISLTKEEIEEDIFAFTGSKPARRPRRRPKNVQKVLDNVFPGIWLAGVSPGAYRVPDAPAKR